MNFRKKANGEVFTSLILVDEMLDKLPTSVFKNKNLRWLDPSAGVGNFFVRVFQRLNEGLKETIPDKNIRRRHILTNMLFSAELCPVNASINKSIFGKEARIHVGSFLDELPAEFDIQFDIVVGNPPYQKVSEGSLNSIGGGNNLYSKFIYKSYRLLKKNGLLIFVTPPTFFSGGKSGKKECVIKDDIFKKSKIHYINLEECSKHFPGVGSKFIYYLIEKGGIANKKLPVVCKYLGKIYKSVIDQNILNDLEYYPMLLTKESLDILKKIKDIPKKFDIKKDSSNNPSKSFISKNKDLVFRYSVQSTGVQTIYSSKKTEFQDSKKVLMSRSGYLNPRYDEGTGVGYHVFFILVDNKESGDKIVDLIDSNIINFYTSVNKWSGFHHIKVIKDIPNISEKKLIKMFTDEELDFIKNNIK